VSHERREEHIAGCNWNGSTKGAKQDQAICANRLRRAFSVRFRAFGHHGRLEAVWVVETSQPPSWFGHNGFDYSDDWPPRPILKKGSMHMQLIFAGISILVFFVTIVNLGPLDLGGWLKAVIIAPLVFLVVYSLARIQPKDTNR
jgi:hypothetical protein